MGAGGGATTQPASKKTANAAAVALANRFDSAAKEESGRIMTFMDDSESSANQRATRRARPVDTTG
jgi:hypothetical protein